jgi:putative ABC transport system ATP-binding protein
VTKPAILLADEPTGALDSVNSANVLHLLQQLVHDRGQTVILVTHDPEIAAAAGRIVRMRDGRIVEILAGAQAESPAGATAS